MTDITVKLEDLQIAISQFSSGDLGEVVLRPSSLPQSEASPPPIPSDNTAVMTDWAMIPSDKYKWPYSGVRFLQLYYSLDASNNHEIGQIQIYSDADKDTYSDTITNLPLPVLSVTQTIVKTINTSTGVSLSIINDLEDSNTIFFEPSAISIATSTVSKQNHGLSSNTVITFTTFGSSLPAGLSSYRQYYISTATSNTFKLATTSSSGSVVAITSQGSGLHFISRTIPIGRVQRQIKDKKFALAFKITSVANPVVYLPANVDTVVDTITVTSHSLANGQKITTSSTGSLPGGLLTKMNYYVTSVSANTFKLAQTLGGDSIDLVSQGSGTHSIITATWPVIKTSTLKSLTL